MYNPAVGRFLSRDTWAYDTQNPMELNRYVYAAGNPVRWMDPSGYSALDVSLITQAIASTTLQAFRTCLSGPTCSSGLVGAAVNTVLYFAEVVLQNVHNQTFVANTPSTWFTGIRADKLIVNFTVGFITGAITGGPTGMIEASVAKSIQEKLLIRITGNTVGVFASVWLGNVVEKALTGEWADVNENALSIAVAGIPLENAQQMVAEVALWFAIEVFGLD